MTGARDQALGVLRDIWQRTGTDLPEQGHGKTCRAMRHVGFDEVDDDLRAAWRAKLEREGKLGRQTVADLLAERHPDAAERDEGVLRDAQRAEGVLQRTGRADRAGRTSGG